MVAPLVALAKAYAVNKAKDFATSKAEDALGLPRDTIGAVVNPAGFAKKAVKDVARDYAKNSFFGRDEIPEEDRSFKSSDAKRDVKQDADKDLDAFKRGGKVKSAAKFQKGSNMKHEDVKMDKSMMQKAVNKHESRLHKGKPMTKLAKGGYTRAADGCATKGKTKGTMITMNKGGMPC